MIFAKKHIAIFQQNINHLRLVVALFFLGLVIPLAIIISYGYQQFESEMYFQYRWKSSNAQAQVNKILKQRIKAQEQLTQESYNFYQWLESPVDLSWRKTLSPLANPENYPKDIGFIGYFQIDATGTLTTPLLPYSSRGEIAAENTQLQWDEIEHRLASQGRIKQLVQTSGLLRARKSPGTGQLWPEDEDHVEENQLSSGQEIITNQEAFQLTSLDGEHLVFYRNIWLSQQRLIQGFVVNKSQFLQRLLLDYFKMARYENTVLLTVTTRSGERANKQYFAYQIDEAGQSGIRALTASDSAIIDELKNTRLYQGALAGLFQDIELTFSTDTLPLGPASVYVCFFIALLFLIIIIGCLGFYHLGLKQIALAEQRMNFVSSVSHELKTPLTSILMYSEMLKSEMVTDKDRQSVYHHFIFDESERLARLINNILQLSHISRQPARVELEYIKIDTLVDMIKSKLDSLLRKHHFQLTVSLDKGLTGNARLSVDSDAFTQVMINLVDNTVKFFNTAKIDDKQRRCIALNFTRSKPDKIQLEIRDFGPGISPGQQDKIFELFYRCGNELTRTTPGTGIGLALVKQLVLAQEARITLVPKEIGVAFAIDFNARY
ncbi:sensor histidine kinase [Thalassomonas actiniarum]|uniref:histidine kinase n=1 Tax=Thalassomonas actiniarum TaxID=485447 RepID=A0AAF0C3V5_9GAMM|nr:HAMP domain-containing sensor histidine kinase [Thalassomonas actiniarum]WDE01617.1 HAMP domain-containing histidine kinase [Thalassomonas actiniarum]